MVTKREAMPRTFHLEVDVSSGEAQRFERTRRAGDLDEVVGRDGALDTNCSPADLLGLQKRG